MPMRGIAVKKALVTAVLVIVVGSLCTVAEAYTKSHIRAAEELLLVMEMPEMVSEMVDMVIESQFQQIPEMAQLEDVFRTFLRNTSAGSASGITTYRSTWRHSLSRN